MPNIPNNTLQGAVANSYFSDMSKNSTGAGNKETIQTYVPANSPQISPSSSEVSLLSRKVSSPQAESSSADTFFSGNNTHTMNQNEYKLSMAICADNKSYQIHNLLNSA